MARELVMKNVSSYDITGMKSPLSVGVKEVLLTCLSIASFLISKRNKNRDFFFAVSNNSLPSLDVEENNAGWPYICGI